MSWDRTPEYYLGHKLSLIFINYTMRRVLYVSPSGNQWKVHWEHQHDGSHFNLKSDAIRYARQIVHQYPLGYVSQIKVQRGDGTFQTEWTYGHDPYPPVG